MSGRWIRDWQGECRVPRSARTGKTHLSIGLGIRACQAGHRVAFATAAEWVARLADAHHAGRCRPNWSNSETVLVPRPRLGILVDEGSSVSQLGTGVAWPIRRVQTRLPTA
ncbi:MAG TPA: ATP-binding protein [Pseudonocardiaceae bacterium]|nr:ATP-binding protein [Pseudonocardiaceae bacterium]